jgi:hypothetical protein
MDVSTWDDQRRGESAPRRGVGAATTRIGYSRSALTPLLQPRPGSL